ncbi:MAG: phosphate signaling complex PhoU family protein, partial [Acidimicrobiales bacterium]
MTTIPTGLADRLAVIEQDLLTMVEMVAERVGLVTSAMLEGDVAAADRLVDADDDIDLLSLQVEEGCIAALVGERLLEVDLRFVVAAMHINMDVERGGDLVSNIAKAVGRLQGSRPDDQVRDLVARMSAQAQLLM